MCRAFLEELRHVKAGTQKDTLRTCVLKLLSCGFGGLVEMLQMSIPYSYVSTLFLS